MELRQLKYFLTVAEELHFRKASEKLHMTQPSLSRQIKQLEEEMGTELFKRTKRSVTLTDAGAFFYHEAQELIRNLDRAISETQQRATGTTGKLRVGYVPSAMHNVLPGILNKIKEDFPGIQLELYQATALVQYEMLKDEKLDIGFLRVPRNDNSINTKVIYKESYSLIVPPDHKLNEKNFKGLHQLTGENFILTPRSLGEKYFDNIISLFTSEGFAPVVIHESVNEHATIKLVENNIGVSIIPSSFKHGFVTPVRFIELRKNHQQLELSLAWRKKNNTPAVLRMVDQIMENGEWTAGRE